MKPRLLRTPEGKVIHPGEKVIIDQPLIGCFVAAALYPSAVAVITHCGPGMNDLTVRYHQDLRPSPPAPPAGIFCLSLDLTTATLWQRRRPQYQSDRKELILDLAAALQISADRIESAFYPAFANILVTLTDSGQLKIDGLT